MYSYGYPGSFNPAVITNKERIIYVDVSNKTGSSRNSKNSSSPASFVGQI